MYRRPKFLEVLLDIRQEMAREADYDADLFAEIVRNGTRSRTKARHSLVDEAAEPANAPDAESSKRTLSSNTGRS